MAPMRPVDKSGERLFCQAGYSPGRCVGRCKYLAEKASLSVIRKYIISDFYARLKTSQLITKEADYRMFVLHLGTSYTDL
ncbi:hypothetical protein PILCRDRAFT_830319 [Piloderma croceum F 1598]|uniref:Uncharacterized protein n=1 Tax=Piloderma croceum (strain F 1598) TaxID=765440 RepID=A0A0C3B2H5_PILCF|nr:hypothetical protein PILCRDRAFT_830319 [Piloderma croceum F 1598]